MTCIAQGCAALNQALLQALKGEGDLKDALLRNVYGNDEAQVHHADTLARYVRRCVLPCSARHAGHTVVFALLA